MAKWGKVTLLTNGKSGVVKVSVILRETIDDSGVGGLIALNDDVRGMVRATNASNDLGKKLECSFGGAVVRQGKPAISLDDADCAQERQVEPFGDDLSAYDDVDSAIIELLIFFFDGVTSLRIAVKPSNNFVRKELSDFGFNEFCADAFVNDVGVMARRATRGDTFGEVAYMAAEFVVVCVESEGHEAARAASRPAAVFAECRGGATAAVMEN